MWRQGWTAILTQIHLSTIAARLLHLGWGCSTVGHWRLQSPQSVSWFSLRHPVSNWLEPPGHLVILFSNAHLLSLFFRLFTQVHLLTDGSVEGQYITQCDHLEMHIENWCFIELLVIHSNALNHLNFVDLYHVELLEVELFDHLTVYVQNAFTNIYIYIYIYI